MDRPVQVINLDEDGYNQIIVMSSGERIYVSGRRSDTRDGREVSMGGYDYSDVPKRSAAQDERSDWSEVTGGEI